MYRMCYVFKLESVHCCLLLNLYLDPAQQVGYVTTKQGYVFICMYIFIYIEVHVTERSSGNKFEFLKFIPFNKRNLST